MNDVMMNEYVYNVIGASLAPSIFTDDCTTSISGLSNGESIPYYHVQSHKHVLS